ncbi:uncharacterized protein LOC131255388 [Magnolia sinica]|uniref:uncharacterized protein LOC131255388 n=1 Tax=Magnolia sinica TaxID=86752 RepID=UPI0026588927|nr:uncharacterized protein LOC131255388 [Magnolia sinica]
MSSWLSLSLPNPFKSPSEEEEEEDERAAAGAEVESEEEEEEEDKAGGVKEDLTELTKTISRQLWGVASFLAPPPPPVGPTDSPPSSPSSQALLGGIRNDFAEIGGTFKTGLSRLSSHTAVNEISRLASTLLQFQPDGDADDDEGSVSVVGVTEEVLEFANGMSASPLPWLEFPRLPKDDFDMSDAQREHASTVEHLVPSLAALKLTLCPSNMSEGCFWKIYFVMLHPILNEHDAELLATPQIVEVRSIMRQQLQNSTKTRLHSSGGEVGSEESNIQEEKSDVLEKAGTVAAAHQVSAHEQENVDQWLEEDGEAATSIDAGKPLGNEEDVSFSDLEIDNDDDDGFSRNASSKAVQDACASSSNGSNKWVQLKQNSEADGDKSKVVRPTSQEKNSEGEEQSDWLTVDDFDFDSGETM